MIAAMNDLSETRRVQASSFTQKERWKERLWFLIMALLLVGLLSAIGVAYSYQQQIKHPVLTRSDNEMINGGKRFVDYFYSLNAATVDRDQFRAISMMMKPEDREARMNYLVENDFVRKTQDSGMSTEIDWSGAKSELVERHEGGLVDVRYTSQLLRNNQNAGQLDILLRLVPVEKSDTNTDGVGVWAWKDIAENPFEGEGNE